MYKLSSLSVVLICLLTSMYAQANTRVGLGVNPQLGDGAKQKTTTLTKAMTEFSLPFISNDGQTDPKVAFYAQTFSGTVYITKSGEIVYSLPPKDRNPAWALVESFADGHAIPVGTLPSTSQVNYIKTKNGKPDSHNVKTYEKLALGNVFQGISVNLIAHANNVEKIYTVTSGADASQIKMAVRGASKLSLNKEGALLAETGNGWVSFTPPIAWQEKNGIKTPVQVNYTVANNRYGFQLGVYDHDAPLMIDPLLQATYLGGTGTDLSDDIQIHPVTGDVYVLGHSLASGAGFTNTFPGTAGGWITQQASNQTAVLARLTADLKTLMQTTFLEPNKQYLGFKIHPTNGDIYAISNKLDANFASIKEINRFSSNLTQLKQSTIINTQYFSTGDFFAISPLSGDLYISGFKDLDRNIFIYRIPADLSAITSTKFGSSGLAFNTHDQSHGITVHPITGDVYVSGEAWFNDFPATAGGYQPNNNSTPATGIKAEGFVALLSPDLATIKQATYLGGTSDDSVGKIAFDSTGNNLFLSVLTRSSDFPGLAGGAFSLRSPSINWSRVVAKMSSDLKNLFQSTIVYTQLEQVFDYSMFVHPTANDVYVIGKFKIVDNTGYPASSSSTFSGRTGNPAAVHFSSDLKSYYGGLPLIDENLDHPGQAYAQSPLTGNIYVAGYQHSKTIPFPQTVGGYQPVPATAAGGNPDMYIARFSVDDIGSNSSAGSGGGAGNGNPGGGVASNPDETPKPFKFRRKNLVNRNKLITSNIVKITGIKAGSAPIFVENGEYSIGCKKKSFTSISGMIANKNTVCVRHKSASAKRSVVTTKLNIGSQSGSFSTTTK